MAKEAWISNRINELEEEIEYHQLQGCGYAIANYLGPELKKHKAMLKCIYITVNHVEHSIHVISKM